MTLVDAATDLRLSHLRAHPSSRAGDALQAHVRAQLGQAFSHAIATRTSGPHDALRAWVALVPTTDNPFGQPVLEVHLDTRPEGVPWVLRTLRELGPLPPHAVCGLDARHGHWAPRLQEVGLFPDAVELVGEPRTALAALGPGPAHEAFHAQGLTLERLTREGVDAVVDLVGDWFRDNPELGWFIAEASYLRAKRERMRQRPPGYAVQHEGRIVGHLEAEVRQTPDYGRCAGMSLILARPWQGKGLATPAYRLLLQDALDQGAQSFKGGTSQPAVLHLAPRMHRRVARWWLRGVPVLPWSRWRAVHPAADTSSGS